MFAKTLRPRGCQQLFIGLPLAWLVGVAATYELQAAPVEFRFEAEVASVLPRNRDGSTNLSLPFAVTIGDTIVATFSFEPATGGPNYPQAGVLRFEIGGEVVEVPQYLIEVHNESVPDAEDLRGRIADPGNTPIVDLGPGTADLMSLSCDSTQDLFCGLVPGHEQLSVWPVIQFTTDNEILSSNDLVADLSVWNGFTFREMFLSFRNSETGGETYIGAYVGAVELVPETRTISLAIVGILSWVSMSRTRRAG